MPKASSSSSSSRKRAASALSATASTKKPAKSARTSVSSSASKAKAKSTPTTSRRSARASSSRTAPAAPDQDNGRDDDDDDDDEQDELASSDNDNDNDVNDDTATVTTTTATATALDDNDNDDNDLDSTLTGYGPEPASDTEGIFMHSAANRIIDLYTAPKPFKNPNWKKSKLKVYKTGKQLLTSQATAAAEYDLMTRMGLSPEEAKRVAKVGDPAFAPLWNKVRAPPFTRPQRKYCDFTGLPTSYTDPVSGLHYYDASVYQQIKAMSSAAVQKCLAMRNKAVVI